MSQYDDIERYVSGEMDAQELVSFESRLREDPALQEALKAWQDTDAIVQKHQEAAAGAEELKAVLTPLTNQYFSKPAAPAKGRPIQMGKWVAAAMAVAAVLIFFFLMPGGIDNYTVDPMPGATVRGVEGSDSKGAQLFNEGKYAAALPLLQQAAAARPDDATIQYYYGITLIKNKLFAVAIPVFERLSKGSSVFKEDSYFFGALAAYKAGNKAMATAMADKVNTQNRYYKNAQKILGKLK